jgi:molybdopterin converting factor small subunit
MAVTVRLPAALAAYSGGVREVVVGAGSGSGSGSGSDGGGSATTVAGVFDRLAVELPALERRIRDERGVIRRHVNVYVDGEDIRVLAGVDTVVAEDGEVAVMAAISGG